MDCTKSKSLFSVHDVRHRGGGEKEDGGDRAGDQRSVGHRTDAVFARAYQRLLEELSNGSKMDFEPRYSLYNYKTCFTTASSIRRPP